MEGDRLAAIARRERCGSRGCRTATAHGRPHARGSQRPDARVLPLVSGGQYRRESAPRAPPPAVPRRPEHGPARRHRGLHRALCSARDFRSIRCSRLIGAVRIEPVFAAHPTESTRRTILRKQQRIAQDLLDRLNPALTHSELDTLWARVRFEITSMWQTEDHPREGLTVADEREHVLFYLIEILYRVVPLFYEEIEAALARAYEVPIETLEVPNLLRFGSMGRRRHGRQCRRSRQDHPRDAAPASAVDRVDLLRRVRAAGGDARARAPTASP